VKAVFLLGALLLTQTPAAAPTSAPSVLPNGDFEQADPANPAKPAHWELSDGLAVAWTNAPDAAHGKAIRMNTALSEQDAVASNAKAGLTKWVFPNPATTAIGESYGLSLYSEPQPVKPDTTYKVTFEFKSDQGTAGKLWFRGYGIVDGKEKRLYEGTVDCGGTANWQTFTGTFHPTRYTPNVTEWKVMLYAIFPDGVAWWDNVRVEEVPGDDDSNE